MFQIEFYSTPAGRKPPHGFILSQEPKAQDKLYEVMSYLKTYGFHLSTTYLRRMTGTQSLWELRAKQSGKQYRLFLARMNEERIVVLHGIIKKTAKTPRNEIKTAEDRLQSYLKGGL